MFITPYTDCKLTVTRLVAFEQLRSLSVSMSQSHGDVTQTPEPKSSSGFASVFKSLTGGGKSSKHNAALTGSGRRPSSTGPPAVVGEPLDLERWCQQLKPGNAIRDRVAAAEALKYEVQDQLLEGVCHCVAQILLTQY